MRIGFLGLLTLIFITLKLCDVIAWSWWLILLPAYAPIILVLVFMGVAAYAAHRMGGDFFEKLKE